MLDIIIPYIPEKSNYKTNMRLLNFNQPLYPTQVPS
jgi:hypothetical protein